MNDDEIIKDSDAISDAISSLITAKPTLKAKDSEVELKTDLSDDEVKGHSILSTLNRYIEMNSEEFTTKCIIGDLIDKKERKAWSKNRMSRSEIVQIARQPEFPREMGQDIRKQGIFNKLFSPKNRGAPV